MKGKASFPSTQIFAGQEYKPDQCWTFDFRPEKVVSLFTRMRRGLPAIAAEQRQRVNGIPDFEPKAFVVIPQVMGSKYYQVVVCASMDVAKEANAIIDNSLDDFHNKHYRVFIDLESGLITKAPYIIQ
jgi:hypothetical protein